MLQKRRRRILPYIPAEDSSQRVKQMGSLASALTALRMEFRAELTYMPGMASRRANQSKFEDGCMQVLASLSLSLFSFLQELFVFIIGI